MFILTPALSKGEGVKIGLFYKSKWYNFETNTFALIKLTWALASICIKNTNKIEKQKTRIRLPFEVIISFISNNLIVEPLFLFQVVKNLKFLRASIDFKICNRN